LSAPNLFSIPPTQPFLPVLAQSLLDGRLIRGLAPRSDPMAMAAVTLYLPTRRALRTMRDLLVSLSPGRATILPRLVALGEADEDSLDINDLAVTAPLRPAIDPRTRRIVLSSLIESFARSVSVGLDRFDPRRVACGPAQTLALADELARLIDDMATRQVSWDALDTLVPDQFDQYWQLTLAFLRIAREAWPAVLSEQGLLDPAVRRDRLIALEAERLGEHPDDPVIVAGSTGSMPATAAFLAAVARHPRGAVVLPGLDRRADETTLRPATSEQEEIRDDAPDVTNPQYAMQGLLQRLSLAPADVVMLAPPALAERAALLSEAMRSTATTDRWHAATLDVHGALDSVTLVEAQTPQEEALAIALVLRELVEQPDRTAALVTPDRTLARRVSVELRRWDVPVDDSGGEPLTTYPTGTFARLVLAAVTSRLAPVDLLAMLKHPLAHLGWPRTELLRRTALMETALLRGPRPPAGAAGLRTGLAGLRIAQGGLHRSDPRRALSPTDLDEIGVLIERLTAAISPLARLPAGARPLADFVVAHRHAVMAMASTDAPDVSLSDTTDGEALMDLFDHHVEVRLLSLNLSEYGDVFDRLAAAVPVRMPGAPEARVRILGPLEARLQSFDRVVLGGLNEGTWPPKTQGDAWLSRPMRHALGLDLPERRIGLSAHDFIQFAGTRDLVLTRALKQDGVPQIASRFLQRLWTVAGKTATDAARRRGIAWLAMARTIDRPKGSPTPAGPPRPAPPVHVRPTTFSVTEIETLLRDPYAIYARKILRLEPLDPVDQLPDAADRGILMHDVMHQMAQLDARLPAGQIRAALTAKAREIVARLSEHPDVAAIWWPKLMRIMDRAVPWHLERAAHAIDIHTECYGRCPILESGTRTIILSGRADRLERSLSGAWTLIDFKTGQMPAAKDQKSGLAPQLPLEAAMLRRGAFEGIARSSAPLGELLYVRLSGSREPLQTEPFRYPDKMEPEAFAEHIWTRVSALLAQYEDASMPYLSRLHPSGRGRAGVFDHFARVAEWSSGPDEDAA
jgi:ATP-dependent helicase/nuclease subunit B